MNDLKAIHNGCLSFQLSALTVRHESNEGFSHCYTAVPEVIGGLMEAEAKLVFDQTPMWMFGSNPKPKKT